MVIYHFRLKHLKKQEPGWFEINRQNTLGVEMITFSLPTNVSMDSPISPDRTVGMAFNAILNWNTDNIRERLIDGNEVLKQHEVDEAILECRKFFMCIVVAQATHAGSVGMMSKKVDEVWHNAILFTREYFALSEQILGTGRYLHHAPVVKSRHVSSSSANVFPEIYQNLFGRIPQIWGVYYRQQSLIWENAMQGICVTELLNCTEEVCHKDAPCSCNEGGQLEDSLKASPECRDSYCDGVTESNPNGEEKCESSCKSGNLSLMITQNDCQGVCNPDDCTTPGQL